MAKASPKDVFLHLFNIVTFYLSAIGFMTICVQYVNALFPDVLGYHYSRIADMVRWFTAMLVISFPAYLLTSWFLSRDLKKYPEKREVKIRKWLLYFTLFLAAITIIVDLIIFVYSFLSGELTVRFVWKVLVVLITAVAIFWYYIWDLKRKDFKTQTPKLIAIIISMVIIGVVIAGFFIIGTPFEQRNRRLDDQRVSDLRLIQSQILNYWIEKEELPKHLIDLEDSISGFVMPKDPENKEEYEYDALISTSGLSFELCANFKTKSDKYGSMPVDPEENWSHEAERTCFFRTIDPELYKNKDIYLPIRY